MSGFLARRLEALNDIMFSVAMTVPFHSLRPWPLLIGSTVLAAVFLVAALLGLHAPRLTAALWLAIVLALLANSRLTQPLQ